MYSLQVLWTCNNQGDYLAPLLPRPPRGFSIDIGGKLCEERILVTNRNTNITLDKTFPKDSHHSLQNHQKLPRSLHTTETWERHMYSSESKSKNAGENQFKRSLKTSDPSSSESSVQTGTSHICYVWKLAKKEALISPASCPLLLLARALPPRSTFYFSTENYRFLQLWWSSNVFRTISFCSLKIQLHFMNAVIRNICPRHPHCS